MKDVVESKTPFAKGVWAQTRGPVGARENMIIGIVDTGIDLIHPSFAVGGLKPYGPLRKYRGTYDLAKEFPHGSCNGKVIEARYFAAAAKKDRALNASLHFASPLDGDGHGRLGLVVCQLFYFTVLLNFLLVCGCYPSSLIFSYTCVYFVAATRHPQQLETMECQW